MAQITSITSEALQAAIRRLLPSQVGFGEDLQASNVITPIIDLTPTAEGSDTPVQLQEALAFGSQTVFSVSGSTSVLSNTAGFYRITAVYAGKTSTAYQMGIRLSDGLANKDVWEITIPTTTTTVGYMSGPIELTVFLNAGDSVSAFSNTANGTISGSIRQIADVNGNLTNPSGFSPQ